MDKLTVEDLKVGAKIKIGAEYSKEFGFEPGEIIELVEGSFDEYNGLYEYTSNAPAIWNEQQKEFDSIFHLFGNDLEHIMDCEIATETQYLEYINKKPARFIKVTARFFSGLAGGRSESDMKDAEEISNYYSGIPLTNEIFEKCGFEYVKEAGLLCDKLHSIGADADGNSIFMPYCTNDKDCYIKMRYLHELQNAIYFFTKTELELTHL